MAARRPTPAQEALLERLRVLLADEPVTAEKSMFGGRCVMVAGKLLGSVWKDGSLLVRVDPRDDTALLERPGAHRPTMGPDREMGAGWLGVAAEALVPDGVATDTGGSGTDPLAFWVGVALAHNRELTGR